MRYTTNDTSIKILDKHEFNPKQILECGQVFRYRKTDEGYEVYSLDKCAKIVEKNDYYLIYTSDVKYFEKYFDLRTDYKQIKQTLYKHKCLQDAIVYGSGIRLLRQDIFETIVSFIISANNNIPRIQGSIEKLCTNFGSKKDGYFAFPTLAQLSKASVQDLKDAGLGYRAEQLKKTLEMLKFINLEQIRTYTYTGKKKFLISLAGVGEKVADCILLFAFNEMGAFPVDTWIAKSYKQIFNSDETNRNKMRENLYEMFGEYSGYAQQYIFYYYRDNKLG